MHHRHFPRHRSPILWLVLAAAASACGKDGDDGDTGADTGSTTSNTGPDDTTGATMPTTAPTTNDEESTSVDSAEVTGPDESTTAPATESTGPADESSTDGGTTAASGFTVTGTVRRDAAAFISNGNDGIGTLYLGVLVECSQNAEAVTGNAIPDVDVSSTENIEEWDIPNVPDGTYYVAGFLDDNGNADPNNPSADMGDLAASEGFGPGCLEIMVAGGDVAAGELVLDFNVPF